MGASAEGLAIERAGIGVLAEAFPLETVRSILKATRREGQRRRLLPAPMMVYYIIALGLFVGVGCREVLRRLLDGAVWIWPDRIKIATDSAITQARQRLGCEPIEALYQEQVGPIAKKATHVFFGAEMDRYGVGETTLARRILLRGSSWKPDGAHLQSSVSVHGSRTGEETEDVTPSCRLAQGFGGDG